MEDCVAIDAKLDMNMVKTLFLCNRQQPVRYRKQSADCIRQRGTGREMVWVQ